MDLTAKKCAPCEGGVDPFTPAQALHMMQFISPKWELSGDSKHLSARFTFKTYKQAWDFVYKISEIAESEGHHPDIKFGWGYANIHLTTHAIGGLSENDFILAAKIDKVNI